MDTVNKIKQVTWIGLLVNLSLVVIKLIGGYLGRSQTVVADAIHSLTDLITDAAILIGVNYWQKPPDENHPYGHKKIETIVTIFIGMCLLGAAVGIFYRAVTSIKEHYIQIPNWLALISVLISIILKEVLFKWTYKVGKRVKSQALCANAYHHRSDVYSSMPAVVTVVCALLFPNLYFIDYIGAVIVSVIITINAYNILKPAWLEITDASVPFDKIKKIEKLALSVEKVISVHALRIRSVSANLYMDLHVQVDGSMSVSEGYEIAKKIKETIYNNIEETVNIIVQIEPDNNS